MIDQTALQRDARAQINDWPVQMRHYYTPNNSTLYHQGTVNLNLTDETSQLLDGGLLDKTDFDVIGVSADFSPQPKNRDRVDIQLGDLTWLQCEVKRTPDFFDPLSPIFTIHIGSPNV